MVISIDELERSVLERGAQDVLGVINNGMLALLVSVGHRTGLFDSLADLTPATRSLLDDAVARIGGQAPQPQGRGFATPCAGMAGPRTQWVVMHGRQEG